MSKGVLHSRRIALTSPKSYGEFLCQHLEKAGAEPVWIPTIDIRQTAQTQSQVAKAIAFHLPSLSGIAFTSRNGIRAIAQHSLSNIATLQDPFYIGALGRDAQLLPSLGILWTHPHRCLKLPQIATPKALVECLGEGNGRSLLCPVPQVIGLQEPSVVPNFLTALRDHDWVPVRVNAYETVWSGPDCARALISATASIDALIFSSTAEVEGLLTSFKSLGVESAKILEPLIIAVHGPVTAQGARNLGVKVQVVSHDSSSFAGVIQALANYWQSL